MNSEYSFKASRRRSVGKDWNTVKKLEKRVKNISKIISNPKSNSKKMNPKKILAELGNMESQIGGIRRRIELVNSDGLCVIDAILVDIAQLSHVLKTDNTAQQFEALSIGGSSENYGSGCGSSKKYGFDEDDEEVDRIFESFYEVIEIVSQRDSIREGRAMNVRALCEKALSHLGSDKGICYEFVDFASQNVPTFSSEHGYGLHLNFFARQKCKASDSVPECLFLEVAFGDPVQVIRCVPLVDRPYPHDNDCIVFHPDIEDCGYCEHAKNGSLTKNFCLPPPYPLLSDE